MEKHWNKAHTEFYDKRFPPPSGNNGINVNAPISADDERGETEDTEHLRRHECAFEPRRTAHSDDHDRDEYKRPDDAVGKNFQGSDAL